MSVFLCLMALIFLYSEEVSKPALTLKCKFNKESKYTYTFKVSKNKLFAWETDNNPNTEDDYFRIISKSNTLYDLQGFTGKKGWFLKYENYQSISWGVYYKDNFENDPYRFLACGTRRVPYFTESEQKILHNN